MQKAYTDCFLFLTKNFNQSGNKKLLKFLTFTYKELLKTFLSGRTASSAINVKFFQSAFEQNPSFGWNFVKMLLKCILSLKPSKAADNENADDKKSSSRKTSDALMQEEKPVSKKDKKKAKKNADDEDDNEGDGSRSNH